jgi:putative CocE/NonD family hydrolase
VKAEPLPVVFTFTPYIGDTYHERAMYFARSGYVYVLVDVRGRGSSEGAFEPFANEGRDGYDVVEFLARQPWSNGKIAMWGGSYAGFDQWTTAKELPPHLATIVPAASAHPGVDFPFQSNVFAPYVMQWLTYTSGATPNRNLFNEGSYWTAKSRELFQTHRPFAELDSLVGNPSPIFHKWLENPTPGPYWDAMVPTPEQYRKLAIPILSITGHYDGDQMGAFAFYRDHMRYGSEEAKAKHFLIVGPWDHAGTRTPNREVGGLTFGPASLVDLNRLHKEWYDWTLKGGPRPKFLEARVAYYVVPADTWKYAGTLEAITARTLTFYLGSDGEPHDLYHSGELSPSPPGSPGGRKGAASASFAYDPLDVSNAAWQAELGDDYLTDESALHRLGETGLVFHSAPFAEAVELTGWPRLSLWLDLDVPDVDLEADLYEVQANGKSVLLSSAVLRARYRESLRQEKLVEVGKVLPYTLDSFTFFSRRVAAGSRLRLLVTSPNAIGVQKNYCSGGVVALESARDARTAHVRLVHDAEHPSRLELPVGK